MAEDRNDNYDHYGSAQNVQNNLDMHAGDVSKHMSLQDRMNMTTMMNILTARQGSVEFSNWQDPCGFCNDSTLKYNTTIDDVAVYGVDRFGCKDEKSTIYGQWTFPRLVLPVDRVSGKYKISGLRLTMKSRVIKPYELVFDDSTYINLVTNSIEDALVNNVRTSFAINSDTTIIKAETVPYADYDKSEFEVSVWYTAEKIYLKAKIFNYGQDDDYTTCKLTCTLPTLINWSYISN